MMIVRASVHRLCSDVVCSVYRCHPSCWAFSASLLAAWLPVASFRWLFFVSIAIDQMPWNVNLSFGAKPHSLLHALDLFTTSLYINDNGSYRCKYNCKPHCSVGAKKPNWIAVDNSRTFVAFMWFRGWFRLAFARRIFINLPNRLSMMSHSTLIELQRCYQYQITLWSMARMGNSICLPLSI